MATAPANGGRAAWHAAARIVAAAARVLLWLVVLGLALVLALLIALRTAPGKRALLRVAIGAANGRMAGHLSVRGIDGDLWHVVTLYDVRLDDAEGLEAIFARRVRVVVDWAGALHGYWHARDVEVDGARLTLRHLGDNRLNLAALGRPRPRPPRRPAAEGAGGPPLIEIDHAHVQVDAAYDPPRGHEGNPIAWPRGSFDFDARARIRGGDVHVEVARLSSDSREPLRAHVELRGGLQVTPRAAPGGRSKFTFEDVVVTVVSDGSELARLHPMVRPRGRWQLRVAGAGPLERLRAEVVASAPAGSITVDGWLGRTYPGMRWEARAVGAGLDGARDWQGLPPGRLDFDVRSDGTGRDGRGEIVVERLAADGGAVRLWAHGRSDLSGHGDGQARLAVDSLARLAALGVPLGGLERVDGALRARVWLARDGAGPSLRAHVDATRLVAERDGTRGQAAAVAGDVTVGAGRPARVVLHGRGLVATLPSAPGRAGPLTVRLSSASLGLRGTPRRFAADFDARTPAGTRAAASLEARLGHDHAEVTVSRLTVDQTTDGRRRQLALGAPARLTVEGTRAAPRLALAFAGARATARLHLQGAAVGGEVALAAPDLERVRRAAGLANLPLAGALTARARFHWQRALTLQAVLDAARLRAGPAAAARLHATVHAVDLAGQARLDGDEVRLGPLALSHLLLSADGGVDRLKLALQAERAGRRGPTRLALVADGQWRTRGLRLDRADLVVRTLSLELPRQRWQLAAPARLHVDPSTLALSNLRARSGVGELWAEARLAHGAIDATVALRDGDLEELSRVAGHPGLLPPARWSGRVHVGGTPAAPVVDARIYARTDRTVAWYGLGFNALSLTAWADRRHAILHADARGSRDTRVVVDAHGLPRSAGDRIVAVAATLDRLQLSVHGHRWELRAPCTLDVGARLTVDGCRLGSGRAEIDVDGSGPIAAGAPDGLDVTVATSHLDVRDVAALFAPGHREPPKTDFELQAHLAGTRRAPVVDVALSGRGSEIDEGGLPENVDYRIRAHYGERRLRGQASMRQVGMRLGIGATFDLPTTLGGDEPVALALEARPVPFFKIRQLLPTPIANLQGFFTLRVRAGGSTRHPTLSAELHAPSWGLDNLRDNDSVVNLAYDGRELVVNSVTSFQTTSLLAAILRIRPQRNSGTVAMELRAPLDLGRVLASPRDAWHALVHDAPLTASAEVRNVDLTKVPLQIVGWDAPLTVGRVEASLRLSGTLHRPSLHGEVHASGLGQPGVVDHLDVDAALALDDGRLHLSGAAALRGAPLVRFRGLCRLDARALVDGDPAWRRGAVDIDLDVPPFALGRLRGLQPRLHVLDGTVRARAALRGSFAAPDFRLVADAAPLQLGGARFSTVHAEARFVDARWRFSVAGDELPYGRLRVAGELPEDWSQPMRMAIDAERLDVGFLSALWEEIGAVHGRLSASVRVAGTRADPRPTGFATLAGGTFQLRGDARRYTGTLAARIDGDQATLTALTLHGGGGTLTASGRAALDGLRPTRLSLDVHADRFEADYGSAAARLDADFTIAGDRSDGIFKGTLALHRGTLRLPALPGSSASLPMGALADVRYDDARARRAQSAALAGQGAFIAARLDGPLMLRSREADLDLGGELDATIGNGRLLLDGVVEARRGTMELLGHRYTVERAMLAFGGPADDPELHLRVTRRIGKATIAIVIEGTAQRPEVRLFCDPPVYDQAQLVSLVLAGRTGGARIALRDLHRQIQGLLSALVIQKIQEQLAPGLPIDVARPLDQQSYSEFSQSPVEVGRFVSDRVYVRYAHRFGTGVGRSAANENEASAEYRLGDGFELDTTFGDAGVGGIYLFWTKRD